MPKYAVKLDASRHFSIEVSCYEWGKVMITTSSYDTATTFSLEPVDALIFWQELGAALDAMQPGATGLRPLPEGDPNEVDAMQLQAQADAKRKESVRCDR